MPYPKTSYDNRAIADISREALDNIEEGLRIGYHAVAVGGCVQITDLLGDTYVLWPFFEDAEAIAQDFGPLGYHFYTSLGAAQELDLWDVPPENKGAMSVYTFNGVDEDLLAADQAFFTVEAQSVFSVGAWVRVDVSSDMVVLSKWDQTTAAEKREWKLYLLTTGCPGFHIYDETNNAGIGRQDSTPLAARELWHFLVGTYHGGADAADIKVYVDGVQADDANIVDDAGFASMVDTSTLVRCGAQIVASGAEDDWFDGKIALPFFTRKELNAAEVWKLYQLGKGLLDEKLQSGMPGYVRG